MDLDNTVDHLEQLVYDFVDMRRSFRTIAIDLGLQDDYEWAILGIGIRERLHEMSKDLDNALDVLHRLVRGVNTFQRVRQVADTHIVFPENENFNTEALKRFLEDL